MCSGVIKLKKIIVQVMFNLGWHLTEIIGVALLSLALVVILTQTL